MCALGIRAARDIAAGGGALSCAKAPVPLSTSVSKPATSLLSISLSTSQGGRERAEGL